MPDVPDARAAANMIVLAAAWGFLAARYIRRAFEE